MTADEALRYQRESETRDASDEWSAIDALTTEVLRLRESIQKEHGLMGSTEGLALAAERMLDACNILWAAHNPDDVDPPGSALDVEDAQEIHSECFQELQSAVYYARKSAAKCGVKP